MKKDELNFVLRHFAPGSFHTRSAYARFAHRTGIQSTWHIRRYAAAAAVVAVCLCASFWFLRLKPTTLRADGSIAAYTLPDGTKVQLTPGSSLTFYGTQYRRVEIQGKAYLDIHHDDSHPFTIEGRQYLIRDIGTRIQIADHASHTEVSVDQGSICLSSRSKPEVSTILTQGMSAQIDAAGSTIQPIQDNPNDRAWATRKIVFDDTPLEQVIHTLEQTYGVKIDRKRLTEKQLSVGFTATFQNESISDILSMIHTTLGVQLRLQKQ